MSVQFFFVNHWQPQQMKNLVGYYMMQFYSNNYLNSLCQKNTLSSYFRIRVRVNDTQNI